MQDQLTSPVSNHLIFLVYSFIVFVCLFLPDMCAFNYIYSTFLLNTVFALTERKSTEAETNRPGIE